MVSEVDCFLDLSEVCCLLCHFYLVPKTIKELFSVFRHFASQSEDELRKTDQIGALLIKYVENMIDFCIGDIDSLLLDDLLELLIVEKSISV